MNGKSTRQNFPAKAWIGRHCNIRWGVTCAVAILGGLLFVVGCNSYNVQALPYDPEMKHVVVVTNSKVQVPDSLEVMADEFNARNIKVYSAPYNYTAKPDEYVVRYLALRSWDLAPYLADATVRISKNDLLVAKGHYHHVGGSASLDIFTKWRSTEWKMKDLYDELLSNFPRAP